MFTGIVEELGHVVSLAHGPDSAVVRIRGPLVTADAAPGASIAVNGIWLAVVELGRGSLCVGVVGGTTRHSRNMVPPTSVMTTPPRKNQPGSVARPCASRPMARP